MGYSIVKQPDDKIAVFSTIVDDFVLYDASEDDIIQFWLDMAADRARDEVNRMLEKVRERGQSGVNSLGHCLQQREFRHGDNVDSQGEDDDEDFSDWLKRMKEKQQ